MLMTVEGNGMILADIKKEKAELLFKLNKLDRYISNNRAQNSMLLKYQKSIMESYVDVLNFRIDEILSLNKKEK